MIAQNLLNQLVELTGNATDAYTVALYRVNSDEDTLVLRHHVSLSSHFDSEAKIIFGKGLIGDVAKSKKTYLEENLKNPTNLCIYKKKEALKSFLAMPVTHKKLEGVLVLDSKESYSFSTKQQKIITGLANQMAWYLNQEQKETSGEEPPESLFRDLVSYCRHIAESPEKSSSIERLMNVPPSILKYDAYAVIYFEPNKIGKVFSNRGFNKNIDTIPIHLGQGLVGSCAKNQCPVILRDTGDRQTVIFGTEENKEPFLSLMAVPIAFNNQLYGVAVCGGKKARSFSNLELNRLTLMGYSAASAIHSSKTKEWWDYNKNLDQITGIPNHRFLTKHGGALEKELLKNKNSVCFLSLQVNNLADLYMSFGIEYGDQLQRGIASTLSKTIPSPKYIFKFSDTIFIVILIDQQLSNAKLLKERLAQVFNKIPFFIDGQEIQLFTELGLSSFPYNGKTLSQLIGSSLPKTMDKSPFQTAI